MYANYVNNLYPIFLAIFLQNLWRLDPLPSSAAGGPHRRLSLKFAASKEEVPFLIIVALYYVTDWFLSLWLSGKFQSFGIILSVGSIFTLCFLGFALLAAMEGIQRAYNFLGWYHVCALVVDSSLVITYCMPYVNATVQTTVGQLLIGTGFIAIYVSCRVIFPIVLLATSNEILKRVVVVLGFVTRGIGLLVVAERLP